MNGDEEIHGDAVVGGASLKFNKKKQSHSQHTQKTDEGDDEDDEEKQRGMRDMHNGDLHSKTH